MPETTAPYSRRDLLKLSDELTHLDAEERAERFGELTAERKEALFRQLGAAHQQYLRHVILVDEEI